MSGGVNRAATTNTRSIAYFLFSTRVLEFTIPIFARKNIKMGSSKIIPNAIRSFMEKERYSLRESMGLITSFPKPTKNLKPNGKTT